MPKAKLHQYTFEFQKKTKNTVVFAKSSTDTDNPMMSTLYIRNTADLLPEAGVEKGNLVVSLDWVKA